MSLRVASMAWKGCFYGVEGLQEWRRGIVRMAWKRGFFGVEAGLLIGGRMDGIRGWLILNWLIGGITGLHPKFGVLMGEKKRDGFRDGVRLLFLIDCQYVMLYCLSYPLMSFW